MKLDLSAILKKGNWVYFIGIKGTGMCALAELFHNRGLLVSGSDTEEKFYTDDILKEMGIHFYESFDASHIKTPPPFPRGASASVDKPQRLQPDLVVYSAAYSPETGSVATNAEVAETQRLGIPLVKYTDALGEYSSLFDSTGVTGVHGKTTTTALAGTMLRGVGLPAQALVGSAVGVFGGRSTFDQGNKYFVAETCEYRRHFLSFHPKRIILTSVESDHQDYYPTYESIRDAFIEYGSLLPDGGQLIYSADDPGAVEVALALKKEKPEINIIPYGFNANGEYKIEMFEVRDEMFVMRIQGFPLELKMRVPGKHTAVNTAAAFALCSSLVRQEYGDRTNDGWNDERGKKLVSALEEFTGSKRRSEILGEANEILFMDDYAHHPTAIKTTLEGLKDFYPKRRLIASFMSHTYTRTATLLDEFASSFEKADIILLHKIYASAREVYSGGVNGKTLFEKVLETGKKDVFYTHEPLDAYELVKSMLRPGDLFITMGAGDNWPLGQKLFKFFSREGEPSSGSDACSPKEKPHSCFAGAL